ncbi:MAG: GntR family transcriptional regulator [Pelagibacterium sp.]|uniref:GntR family transcriptional regulator n=1 Tax=Pelagibacterium sp. TaxID=1967288 RepID=UPI0032F0688A
MSDSASDKKERADQPLKAVGRLRSDIILGVFRPGEWLRQVDLQDRLGCSRFAVRQALSELALAQVVEHVPNRGFRVAAPSTTIRSEITDVRLMLELPAATEIVAVATARHIAVVRDAAHAFDAAIEDASFQRLRQINHEFHRALLEPIANETLANLINELRERDLPGDWSSWTSPSGVRQSSRDHLEMVEALEARNAENLQAIIRRHVTNWRKQSVEMQVL